MIMVTLQAKQSEEQAKKMGKQSEQLAGEVVSLREALENLGTHMAATCSKHVS